MEGGKTSILLVELTFEDLKQKYLNTKVQSIFVTEAYKRRATVWIPCVSSVLKYKDQTQKGRRHNH